MEKIQLNFEMPETVMDCFRAYMRRRGFATITEAFRAHIRLEADKALTEAFRAHIRLEADKALSGETENNKTEREAATDGQI
jgi:hypothetical protein